MHVGIGLNAGLQLYKIGLAQGIQRPDLALGKHSGQFPHLGVLFQRQLVLAVQLEDIVAHIRHPAHQPLQIIHVWYFSTGYIQQNAPAGKAGTPQRLTAGQPSRAAKAKKFQRRKPVVQAPYGAALQENALRSEYKPIPFFFRNGRLLYQPERDTILPFGQQAQAAVQCAFDTILRLNPERITGEALPRSADPAEIRN